MKERVNSYFSDNNISKQANVGMVLKTILMLSLFIAPITLINLGIVEQVWLLFALYIISGLGMAGIGMGVMHDAIHGSYSKNRMVNKILGYSMNIIGANAGVWKIQHNVLHHTYTNIDEADDDINTPPFLRFTPNRKWMKVHRYQHIYIWFFYSLSTISWITTKDFIRVKRYWKMGLVGCKATYRREMLQVFLWKASYYVYALILPMIFLPFNPFVVFAAFISMHMITGISISAVFQTAHIMPDMEFPKMDEDGKIEKNWAVHQLETTANYAPKSTVFSWLIGGLNYQVEHHLFPNICHVHYRKLSKIVKATAEEFNVPYYSHKTFLSALNQHTKTLQLLGRPDADKEPNAELSAFPVG
ncbi:fatty acid desaturase family protein [Roseivirga sp.]|uniref:fatty acid desaturase family protein n=1 Tax=Roseivirga sp. TaxID=1964215 RepID=UPI003BAD1344